MQPSFTQYENRARAKIISTIVTLVVIAGTVLMVDHLKAEKLAASSAKQAPSTSQVSVTPSPSSNAGSATSTSTTSSSSSSKDGTYTASSSYYVPHGQESIKVSLTLNSGTITNASITNSEGDPTSAAYQQDFASEYKSYVVGKKITDVQLGVIAGASDTSQGFEAALNQIASQAQA